MNVSIHDAAGTAVTNRPVDYFGLLHRECLPSPSHGMAELVSGLRALRTTMSSTAWRSFIDEARNHELMQVIHQCPFTRHAFERPAGYPGDARLLDYMYFQELPNGTTEAGAEIFGYATESLAPKAVVARAQHFAKLIDDSDCGTALSIACGHLREAEYSNRLRSGDVAVTAMDQDEQSLATVTECYSNMLDLKICHSSVRRILTGSSDLGEHDLVYCGGLYDYLEDRIAVALTKRLLQHVAPGGRLILANFAPWTRDAGYMECCMDWWLIYRDQAGMDRLCADALGSESAFISRIYPGSTGEILFAEIQRR